MDNNLVHSKIDSSRSRLSIKAFAIGLLSSFGHNPSFAVRQVSGEIDFVPDHPEESSLRIQIPSTSLELTDDVSVKDRKEIEETMRGQVLEIDRYPIISFQSTSVKGERIYPGTYRISITGNLQLHGVTRVETFDAQVTANGDQLRASGEVQLQQSNYRIRPVSAIGGTLKLKDEIKLSFDIVAHP